MRSLVFTAHPTEAKRRSVRSKVRVIRERAGVARLQPATAQRGRIAARSAARRVDHVVADGSDSAQSADGGNGDPSWPVVPIDVVVDRAQIYATLREASLATAYPDESPTLPKLLSFGTWIGGDRDGHPFVTPP